MNRTNLTGLVFPAPTDPPSPDYSFDYVCAVDGYGDGCMTKWQARPIFESDVTWEYGNDEGSHYIECPNCGKMYLECQHFNL